MWKNKLLYLVLFSLLFHGAAFFTLSPTFEYNKAQEQFLYWWGDIYSGEKNKLDFYKRKQYSNFFLSKDKNKIAYLKKGSSNISLIEDVDFKKAGEPNLERSSLVDQRKFIDLSGVVSFFDRYGFFLDKNMPTWKDVYSQDNFKVKLLVSPAGRVIVGRYLKFPGYLDLRGVLEGEVRKLMFPARNRYYWRDVELMIK